MHETQKCDSARDSTGDADIFHPDANLASGLGMVDSIVIRNFRGFAALEVKGLAPINVIVGDNGVGKTALLEAVFLALSGSPDKALSLKAWRGMETFFQTGNVDSVVEGVYADLFHDPKTSEPISIQLRGRGFENRKLVISKESGDIVVPGSDVVVGANRQARRARGKGGGLIQVARLSQSVAAPISLTWSDESGAAHISRVLLGPLGLQFEGTGESIPNSFMFAAQAAVPPQQAAEQYSALRKSRATEPFRSVFLSVFEFITDISVETTANVPVLVADVPWAKQLLSLAALSGGTNRVASILLSLASRRDGVVLIDEVESGIYHARQERFAKALTKIARTYKTQIIMTTHSEEWIEHFLDGTKEDQTDIAFWRLERSQDHALSMVRFTAEEFSSGLSAGEMR